MYLGVLASILTISLLQSQNINEVLRYSTSQLNGSARYVALGGAFGALGGDLSAISSNPAGTTVFVFNEGSVTGGTQSYVNDAAFFNTNSSENKSTFNVSQLGFSMLFQNPSASKWDKLAFGFNSQLVNNFNKQVYFEGLNPTNGLKSYFLEQAAGISYNTFNFDRNVSDEYARLASVGYAEQQTYLALKSFLMGYDGDTNEYFIPEPENAGIQQTHLLYTSGGQRLYTLNFAGRYSKKLSIGINLNLYTIDYTEGKETFDYYVDQSNSLIKEMLFIQDLRTFGTGASFQVGALYQATKSLRLGLSYTTPTFYELEDEYEQRLLVDSQNDLNGEVFREDINPNVITVNGPYNIKTPSQTQASAALVIGNKGFLSADYGVKNYSGAKVSDRFGYNFNGINMQIENELDSASYLRVGGETRIADFSLRAGYWTEQSPYRNQNQMEDFSGYSIGAGIRFKASSLDVALSKSDQNYAEQMYSLGLTDSALINQQSEQIIVTYSFRF